MAKKVSFGPRKVATAGARAVMTANGVRFVNAGPYNPVTHFAGSGVSPTTARGNAGKFSEYIILWNYVGGERKTFVRHLEWEHIIVARRPQ